METKHCKKCDKTKPVDQFAVSRGRPAHRCLECQRAWNKEYRARRPAARKESQKRYIARKMQDPQFVAKHNNNCKNVRKRRRLAVLNHYSNNDPKCVCCGEINVEFLTIDHTNGGGNKHRKEIGGSSRLYIWLKNNGYPDGYRVLCSNCNLSYGSYGYCPHQKEKK